MKKQTCFVINVKGEDVRAIITDYGNVVGVVAACYTYYRPIISAEDILRALGKQIDEQLDQLKQMLAKSNYWELVGLQPAIRDLEYWGWKLNKVQKENVYYEIIDVSR